MKRILLTFFLLAVLNSPAQGMNVEVSVSHFRPNLLGKYTAGNLLDDNATTVWASSALNHGVGAWFQVDFPEMVALREITIYNGHHGGEFQDFSRIKSGRLLFSDGSEQHFEFEDGAVAQKVEVWPVPTTSVRVLVDAIYPETPTRSMSLAISEVKFSILKGVTVPKAMPEGGLLGELANVIKGFYTKQLTLDEGFLDYFPKQKRAEEEMSFEVFRQIEKQKGMIERLRQAVVNTDDLKFRLMSFKRGVAEVHSFGHYSVVIDQKMVGIPDDSVFTLKKENGDWKVFEIRDYAVN